MLISTHNTAQSFVPIWQIVECSLTKYVVVGSSPIAGTSKSDIAPVLSIDISYQQANIELRFTLKCVRYMMITYSQIILTGKTSQLSSIMWSVWPNGWVFVYKISGYGFQSLCIHLNLWYRFCYEQGARWSSGKHRVWIHCEMHTWDVDNRRSKATCI